MRSSRLIIVSLVVALVLVGVNWLGDLGHAEETLFSGDRQIFVVSDLHFGLGCDASKRCDPTEDFRWSKAWAGFLREISRRSGDRTDLVIAGDLLELWQPPSSMTCTGSDADIGCTPMSASAEEMKRLVLLILEAHQDDIRSLRDFSQRGENRVLIIPGNHDASLLVPSVWSPVGERLDEHSGRVTIVKEGVWNSSDGKVLVEHGHQIGEDVNRFADWPVVLREDHGRQGLVRTWGERFVQKIFNERERQYQIIDNLSPESAGAAYLLGNRGVGGSAQDLATFVKFHLFELSWAQRWQELGTTKTEK